MITEDLPDIETMTTAYRGRDGSYDGVFYTAVKTTGIFCRPTCKAKSPLAENVAFYSTPAEAIQAGFRPCKLCRPMDPSGKPPGWIRPLLDAVEADPDQRWHDSGLAALHIDPARARRWFKEHYGMTFHAYSRARRLGQALGQIKNGQSVIQAAYGQDYQSLSGFNDAFKKLLGQPPTAARGGATIYISRVQTPLGLMLAGATEMHLYLLEYMDRRAIERQLAHLQRRLRATLLPGETAIHALARQQIADYFDGSRREFTIPLKRPGTPFQQRVWTALQNIPYAETRSYAQIASAIGQPQAVRAVANANGSNRLAIIIPCHRVIGSDGKLTGYGGGLWRKKRLLELESLTPGRL